MTVPEDSKDIAALPGYLLNLHMRISPDQYKGVGLKKYFKVKSVI